ncbi:hypothetical protein HWV62_41667 [Athelia sp. TMB]|nr:hypothetical protein HWV62_41667 [Athelia sp. TMB]
MSTIPFREALSRLENRRVKMIRPLIPPQILQEDLPLTLSAAETVLEGRRATEMILKGDDDRIMVVVGPCSVNNVDAALEYARKLRAYAEEAKSDLHIVMRVYFEKPRTTVGWKGLINDPDMNSSFQINKGLRIGRSLLLDIAKMGLPAGCEFLDTISPQYIADLVSWGAIGARTTESQVHRELTSALSMPTGFKNSTDGTVGVAIDACRAARSGHVFLSVGKEGLSSIVETEGNPDVHVILRGGAKGPNYSAEFVSDSGEKLKKAGLPAKIMIDCSHGNSSKQHQKQVEVAEDIAKQLESGETAPYIMGVMVESNLVEGRQDIPASGPAGLKYGQSVTDACISWETTVPLLNRLREGVQGRRKLVKAQALGLNGSFLTCWILAECDGLKGARPAINSSSRRTLVDGTRLLATLAIHLWRRREEEKAGYSRAGPGDEELPLHDLSSPAAPSNFVDQMTLSDAHSLRPWTTRSLWALSVLGLLCALRDNLLCGFLVVRATFTNYDITRAEISSVLALGFASGLSVASTDYVYKKHDSSSVNTLNILVFASSFVVDCLISLSKFFSVMVFPRVSQYDFMLVAASVLVEAGRDIAAMFIISHFDAPFLGVLCALGGVILLLGTGTALVLVGCAAISVGAVSYLVSCQRPAEEKVAETAHPPNRIYRALEIISFVALFLSTLYSASHPALPRYKGGQIPSLESGVHHHLVDASCPRPPLASPSWHQPRVYHEFDDVLLIVFFSHARYDVNLDNYKKTYAPYFPNIVFIGPASREDKGFSHSYDVMVDSYQSEEDLSDMSYYKMAGRMAHHMLYTAMSAHPCYDGYLWVPFDTLLNLPRLQQFDQRYFWYHSPWGTYVPNPAFGNPQNNLDKARHPPPLRISPDPALNATENWGGWNKDWWWGDPHMGLEVCMQAFNKVPEHQRARLAAFNDGETRLLGGSSDTIYIPGKHRETFLSTLALFLETDCFLEIATPTTVHLTVPLDEPILFVDHWWIWDPPFNADFVRQKWAEGKEVDTFHTYHWGDKDMWGVWRETPGSVQDMHKLLRESAVRQHVEFHIL